MEEKERFELLNDNFIYDKKLKEYVVSPSVSLKCYMGTLVDLLNQQDKEIKELKEENIKLKKIMGVMKNKKIEELQECKCDNCGLTLLYPVKDSEFVNDLKLEIDSLCDDVISSRLSFYDLLKEYQQLKQTQKEHIINVLENIMSLCRNGISDHYSLKYVCTIIENKIKKLKGETI